MDSHAAWVRVQVPAAVSSGPGGAQLTAAPRAARRSGTMNRSQRKSPGHLLSGSIRFWHAAASAVYPTRAERVELGLSSRHLHCSCRAPAKAVSGSVLGAAWLRKQL